MADQPVYSTATGAKGRQKKEQKSSHFQSGSGPLKMRRETKGRGGKAVTILFNLPMGEAEAKELCSKLKAALGCGGSLKGSEIILAGDIRDRVEEQLAKLSLKVVRAGG